jgi:hypothetical protein
MTHLGPRLFHAAASVISTRDRQPHQKEEVMFYGTSQPTIHQRPGRWSVRTLAIRIEDELHAQLGMIAKLEDLSLTDALLQAIDQWIRERRNNPELQARAAAVIADLDREAATRRGAIEALLGDDTTSKPSPRRGRPKPEPTEE